MLYHAPTGSTDPNAPFVGKNVAAGIIGSKVPPGAVEYTQREIVNAITLAGLTPTDTDLFQLTRAIRGGQLDFSLDTGTSDALVAKIGLAHTAIKAGLPFSIIKGVSPNATTTPTLTIEDESGNNGLTATITKNNGSAVAIGDLPANSLLVFRAISPTKVALVSLLTFSDIASLILTGGPINTAVTNVANTAIQAHLALVNGGSFGSGGSFGGGAVTNWVVPAGVTRVRARVYGAGGGGGGTTGGGAGAAGGGGGGYAEGIYSVTPGQTIVVTAGTPGLAGGAGTNNSGTAGGTSSFGSFCSATGGQGGLGSGGGAQTGSATGGGGVNGNTLNIGGTPGTPAAIVTSGVALSGAGGNAYGGAGGAPTVGSGNNGATLSGGGSGGANGGAAGNGGLGLVVVEFI